MIRLAYFLSLYLLSSSSYAASFAIVIEGDRFIYKSAHLAAEAYEKMGVPRENILYINYKNFINPPLATLAGAEKYEYASEAQKIEYHLKKNASRQWSNNLIGRLFSDFYKKHRFDIHKNNTIYFTYIGHGYHAVSAHYDPAVLNELNRQDAESAFQLRYSTYGPRLLPINSKNHYYGVALESESGNYGALSYFSLAWLFYDFFKEQHIVAIIDACYAGHAIEILDSSVDIIMTSSGSGPGDVCYANRKGSEAKSSQTQFFTHELFRAITSPNSLTVHADSSIRGSGEIQYNADLNGDSKVSLSEAYQYTQRRYIGDTSQDGMPRQKTHFVLTTRGQKSGFKLER